MACLIDTPLSWGDERFEDGPNRFSGFHRRAKTAEAVRAMLRLPNTPLKWGVNENGKATCKRMGISGSVGASSVWTGKFRRKAVLRTTHGHTQKVVPSAVYRFCGKSPQKLAPRGWM